MVGMRMTGMIMIVAMPVIMSVIVGVVRTAGGGSIVHEAGVPRAGAPVNRRVIA